MKSLRILISLAAAVVSLCAVATPALSAERPATRFQAHDMPGMGSPTSIPDAELLEVLSEEDRELIQKDEISIAGRSWTVGDGGSLVEFITSADLGSQSDADVAMAKRELGPATISSGDLHFWKDADGVDFIVTARNGVTTTLVLTPTGAVSEQEFMAIGQHARGALPAEAIETRWDEWSVRLGGLIIPLVVLSLIVRFVKSRNAQAAGITEPDSVE